MSAAPATVLSLGGLLETAARRLAAAGVDGARRDARLLLAHALGVRAETVLGYPERAVGDAGAARFEALVERRAAREPVSRILGRREFWGLSFRVTPDVLDPRPESEVLVEGVLSRLGERDAPHRILDLGTGSGCLLLALLAELTAARGLGVDASGAALAVARANAEALGLAGRAAFEASDWGRGLTGAYDAVVCNPPYVADGEWPDLAPEVARYDPTPALSGGPDGLAAYRALLPHVARLLRPGGLAALEHGAAQAAAVERLAAASGLTPAGCLCDLAGRERCLLATVPA